jgi:hypothetical protein
MRPGRTFVLTATLVVIAAGAPAFAQTFLGTLSANPHAPGSTSAPGSQFDPNSVNNPYGRYGSPYSAQSATNPYATDAPKLYDGAGNYRGKLSANRTDPDSVSNPYGRYGSTFSPDSPNNPAGAGNPHGQESPHNRFGTGLKIFGTK